jgi:hypothetical protein
MQINTNKTKEMILGPLSRSHLPYLTTSVGTIERVSSFKLLGVYVESTLSWTIHVDNMIKKVTQRLYFLKQLKRAGLSSSQLFHYYIAVIRPVLEYGAPVWHYALTKAQTEQLEAVQKRAIQIILNYSRGTPYLFMLSAANLTLLATRREEISRNFFSEISEPTSCLYHLFPEPREHSITSRLRTYEKFSRVLTRTKRYCSFLNYAINHYQDRKFN